MSTVYERELGRIESSLAPPYISNVVTPACLSLRKPIDIDTLRKAVHYFAQKQPNLSHAISKEGEKLKFACADPNYEYFEVLPAETDWKNLCLQYCNELLHKDSRNNPGIKIFCIPSLKTLDKSQNDLGKCYLIAVFLHCLSDGTNGMTIINDILTVYEKLMHDGVSDYAQFPNPPAVEDMMSSYFCIQDDSLKDAESEKHYKEVKEKFIKHCISMFRKFNYSLPFYENKETGPVIANKFYVSTSDVYEKFLRKCKEMKITVGTAFIAIKYFAYASFAFQEALEISSDEIFVGVNVPFNLRKRVPLDIKENCVNLAALQNFITPGIKKVDLFWEFALKVKDELNYIVENEFYLFDYVYIDKISGNEMVRDYLQRNGVYVQGFVSNMKKYPHSREYKDFMLDSIHCVGGLFLPDWDHLELYIYSTDRFNLSYVHRDGGINNKIADYVFMLIVYLTENLSELANSLTVKSLIERFPLPPLADK